MKDNKMFNDKGEMYIDNLPTQDDYIELGQTCVNSRTGEKYYRVQITPFEFSPWYIKEDHPDDMVSFYHKYKNMIIQIK